MFDGFRFRMITNINTISSRIQISLMHHFICLFFSFKFCLPFIYVEAPKRIKMVLGTKYVRHTFNRMENIVDTDRDLRSATDHDLTKLARLYSPRSLRVLEACGIISLIAATSLKHMRWARWLETRYFWQIIIRDRSQVLAHRPFYSNPLQLR